MRTPLYGAVVIALVAAAAAQRSGATVTEPVVAPSVPLALLGISHHEPKGALAWFKPLTLRMLPGRKASLAGHLGSWVFSADRSTFAIANCGDAQSREIRFVNARAMRVVGDLRLALSADCTSALTWLRPRRLLAFVETASGTSVAVVDPVARRVLRREPLPSTRPQAIGRTQDDLVALLDTRGSFAPARLAVIDAEGRTRIRVIDRVLAGTVVGYESADYRSRTISPGLAVDPEGRRAFVVPASGPVAEVDLETLAVTYHVLDPPSLLQRFLGWLTPSAQAKMMEGPVREARWLGDGMIAVSGTDYAIATNARGEERMTATPAGVSLVDTRSWTSRVLDREASGFAVVPGLVIAQGGRWDSGRERGYGPGLRAFGLDGRERWRLHAGEYRWMDVAGSVGYVYALEGGGAEVVDLATGRVLGAARWDDRNPLPQLLATQASGW